MTAHLVDGAALARRLRAGLAAQVRALQAAGMKPGLAVVLLGDDPASHVYVRHKIKACEETGVGSFLEKYEATLSERDLLARIEALNRDARAHGILVQLPLPKHIDARKIIQAISPQKDADGFHVANAGALMAGMEGFWPCTPHGCMKMLESIGYALPGKHAVVIGRSNIVGKPMAMLLLRQNATVTICHSGTRNLKALTREADVLVAAAGKARLVTGDMVKEGAVVLDVGMNRTEEGKLCGDVDFESVRPVAGYMTPVPGGVGPMTIAMLLANTLESARRAACA